MKSLSRFTGKETYPVYGLHSEALNHYNGAKINLTNIQSGLRFIFEARVFNDAYAFRFIVPGSESSEPGRAVWNYLNGTEPETMSVALDFPGNGNYNTLILCDEPGNPAAVRIKNGKAKKEDILEISLDTGGGYMCRFTPGK